MVKNNPITYFDLFQKLKLTQTLISKANINPNIYFKSKN